MWPVVFYVSHVTMRILWFVSLCAPPPILRYGNSRMKAVVEKLGAHTVSILSSSLLTKQLLAMPTGPACLKHIAAIPEQRDNCDQWNVSEVQGPSQKMKQKDGRSQRLGRTAQKNLQDEMGRRHSWLEAAVVAYTRLRQSQHRGGGACKVPPTPIWGTVGSWWLCGERGPVFFRTVATRKLSTLKRLSPHLHTHGQH